MAAAFCSLYKAGCVTVVKDGFGNATVSLLEKQKMVTSLGMDNPKFLQSSLQIMARCSLEEKILSGLSQLINSFSNSALL